MADLIVRCAIVIAVLSLIWRRLYIEHFWVRGRATVIQVNLEFITDFDGVGDWIWVSTIEYYARGQRWVQRGPISKYRVGDEFDILYNPRKPRRWASNAWSRWTWAATLTAALGIIFVLVISS